MSITGGIVSKGYEKFRLIPNGCIC